jgi:hypothetical protein
LVAAGVAGWAVAAAMVDMFLFEGTAGLKFADSCEEYTGSLPGAFAIGYTSGDHFGQLAAALLGAGFGLARVRASRAALAATLLAAVQLAVAVTLTRPVLASFDDCGPPHYTWHPAVVLQVAMSLAGYPLAALVGAWAAGRYGIQGRREWRQVVVGLLWWVVFAPFSCVAVVGSSITYTAWRYTVIVGWFAVPYALFLITIAGTIRYRWLARAPGARVTAPG